MQLCLKETSCSIVKKYEQEVILHLWNVWSKGECKQDLFYNMNINYSFILSRGSLLRICWVTPGGVHMSMVLAEFIPPSPHPRVCLSLLYVCISIPALQIGSVVPFFQITYICINIWYLLSSFWLTSLCVTDSITVSRTALMWFMLWYIQLL